jgi:signal peptidase II
MLKWLRSWCVLACVGALVGCDQVSKGMAADHLAHAAPAKLYDSWLELRYTENRDMAFNALRFIPDALRERLLLVGGALALGGLVLLMLRRKPPFETVAVAVISAGAAGNYWDRVAHGYVIDFVHVARWPVFNLADVYITLGGLALLLGHRHVSWLRRSRVT